MSNLVRNFGFAAAGVRYFFNNERNGRIQLVIAMIVVTAGFFLNLSTIEWCLLLFCIALVLGLEMMNTAVERACEMLSSDFHPMVKVIKDVAAGAVLCAAIASVIIGILVFYPHVKLVLQNN